MIQHQIRRKVNCFFELNDKIQAKQYDKFNRANTSVATYAVFVIISSIGFMLEICSTALYVTSLPLLIIQPLPVALLLMNWYKLYELRKDHGDYYAFNAFSAEEESLATACDDGGKSTPHSVSLFRRARSAIATNLAESVIEDDSVERSHCLPSSVSIPNAVVTLTSLYYGLRLIFKQQMDVCTTQDFLEQIACNNYAPMKGPDLGSLLLVFIIPVIYPIIVREVKFRFVMVAVCIVIASVITAAAIGNPSHWAGHVLIIFTTAMAIMCYESERQNLQLFMATERLSKLVTDNKRLADESIATDMRHLIGNVAHDLKTPLTSFTSAIQFISDVIREGKQSALNNKLDTASAEEIFSSVLECTSQVRNTNAFMEMTINRCIDYTKASTGVNLVPRLETINLIETISLPLKIIGDLPSKVTVKLRRIDPGISTQIITDKQWLQENILCLLSNAVKYSVRGVVELFVIFHTDGNKEGLQNSVAEYSRVPFATASSGQNLRTKPAPSVAGARAGNSKLFFGRNSKVADVPSNDTDDTCAEITPKIVQSRSVISPHNSYRQMSGMGKEGVAVGEHSAADQGSHIEARKPSFDEVLLPSSTCDEGEGRGMIRFEVHDTGIGLSDEVMKRLFSPFSRAQRMAGGTGLGLFSLAKRVEALNGTYGVQKRHDGQQGCLFWFTIPYRPDIVESELVSTSIKMMPDSVMQSFFRQGLPSFRSRSSFGLSSRGSSSSRSSEISAKSHSSGVSHESGTRGNRKGSINIAVDENAELSPHLMQEGLEELDLNISAATVADVKEEKEPHSLHSAQVKQASCPPKSLVVRSIEKLRILQVDDSLTILKMVGMMLRRSGHIVEAAENGAIGVEMVSAACTDGVPYDVILMDLQMPVMDGLEATRRIRQYEQQMMQSQTTCNRAEVKNMPETLQNKDEIIPFEKISRSASTHVLEPHIVIGVSANSDDMTRQAALDVGVDAFMSKPFTLQVFYENMERILHGIHSSAASPNP